MTAPGDNLRRILEFVRDNPGSSFQVIADELALEERSTRLVLEDLKRRGTISDDAVKIRLQSDVDIDSVLRDLSLETDVSRLRTPTVVDELIRRVTALQKVLTRYRARISSEIRGKAAGDLIALYQDKLGRWIQMAEGNPAMDDTRRTLELDREFMQVGKGLIRIQESPGKADAANIGEFRIASLASYNDLKSLPLKGTLMPISISLMFSQKAGVIKTTKAEPRILYDPDVPSNLSLEHIKDIAEYPADLEYNGKIRVRYSENKTYLYQYSQKLMQEYAPTGICLGESILPPDMFYRDFENPYRRKKHLSCMQAAVSVAEVSKIFDCPIAQVSRSASTRRRETSIWTRLVFGILAENSDEYIDLSSRGNFDDVIYGTVSEDADVGPVFTLSESYPYIPDDSVAKKASGVLRFRFYSAPTSEAEELQWAIRLCTLGYREAFPDSKVPGVAYLSGVERAIELASRKASETFDLVMRRLTAALEESR